MKNLAIILLSASILWNCSPTREKTGPIVIDSAIVYYDDLKLDTLILPEGFKIDVFARVENARSLAKSPDGTIFVGSRGAGEVHALKDENGDFKADKKILIDSGLRSPNGVAYANGNLYIAEISKLWKYPNVLAFDSTEKELIYDDYPTDGHHGAKYIAFGPDGKLYIPVGAPCNICESKDPIYASITRMNPDGSGREIVAHGVRNTVGFDWHPTTKELYFTDNGRDRLGDSIPNCELNKVTETGQHFGYPYCHQGNIKDPEFGDKYPCSDFIAPFELMGPHVAPLGMKFYTGSQFPEKYKGNIFVALHGSWNRTEEAGHTGYKVVVVKEENGKSRGVENFIEGFLNKATNERCGRPVDLLVLDDGSMLLSDDMTGTVYRISYED